jgi:hypothetical protein
MARRTGSSRAPVRPRRSIGMATDPAMIEIKSVKEVCEEG